ncbi:hypothetical protein OF83DRAFT_1033953, partial [Amylostereum chailletii]
MSISTTFHPGASVSDASPPDLCVSSSDATFFFVHAHRLLAKSSNGFGFLLPTTLPTGDQPILDLPLEAKTLNVLLHVVYNISADSFRPTLDVVLDAMDAMPSYGYAPKAFLTGPSMPLFSLLTTCGPSDPLECYTRAASLDLEAVAVAVSAYIPLLPIWQLTDREVERMGPVYFKRLVFLHLGRVEALKRLLCAPPDAHTSTPTCDLFDQNNLRRAWMLAVSYLTWEPRPGLSASSIELALRPLADELTCRECRSLMSARIKQVQVEWSLVK